MPVYLFFKKMRPCPLLLDPTRLLNLKKKFHPARLLDTRLHRPPPCPFIYYIHVKNILEKGKTTCSVKII